MRLANRHPITVSCHEKQNDPVVNWFRLYGVVSPQDILAFLIHSRVKSVDRKFTLESLRRSKTEYYLLKIPRVKYFMVKYTHIA